MAKTIFVAGYGPGISNAAAERFGKAGFKVALVSRSADRLDQGVEKLGTKGVEARAFRADLGDAAQVRDVVGRVRKEMGPIDAIVWVAYNGAAGDLTKADPAELRGVLDLSTTSLVAAVNEALPDLRAQKGAVLVTNGGFGLFDEKVDALVAQTNAMGLAIANAAKHKLVGVLSQKLRGEGVFVGEVMVLNVVKGTAFDQGSGTLEASAVGAKFWELYEKRSQTFVQIG